MQDVERQRVSLLIKANLWLTGLFAATAAYAAIDFSTTAQWVGAVTAMSLFAIGVFAFLWSYYNAVQRSRQDEISVTQLYLLLGPAIPAAVRRTMNLTLLAQVAIATATTLARPNGPDGNPGSSLAVGFLVPMLGFGLNGLWAVTHGRFAPRREPGDETDVDGPQDAQVAADAEQIGQNAQHG